MRGAGPEGRDGLGEGRGLAGIGAGRGKRTSVWREEAERATAGRLARRRREAWLAAVGVV